MVRINVIPIPETITLEVDDPELIELLQSQTSLYSRIQELTISCIGPTAITQAYSEFNELGSRIQPLLEKILGKAIANWELLDGAEVPQKQGQVDRGIPQQD